jgi:isoamylase
VNFALCAEHASKVERCLFDAASGKTETYCLHNELSRIDWERADQKLLDFSRKLIHLRRSHPVFCRRRWFKGRAMKGTGVEDIAWFLPDGTEMTEPHFDD